MKSDFSSRNTDASPLRAIDRRRERLREEIEASLLSDTPRPINLSIPRHGETAPVLRVLAYDRRFSGKFIRVVFSDGSAPPTFPVGTFVGENEPPRFPESKVLRIGLMSFRHPELDYLVDLYVTRNLELAEEATMADEERLAFDRTVAIFNDASFRDGGEVWAYHTGLEPMVVGFYRGVSHVLLKRQQAGLPRTLTIRPWLFIAGTPDRNKPLSRESREAQPESYEPCDAWW